MLFYKFTKNPGIHRVPGYDLNEGNEIVGYLSGDSFMSDMDETDID